MVEDNGPRFEMADESESHTAPLTFPALKKEKAVLPMERERLNKGAKC